MEAHIEIETLGLWIISLFHKLIPVVNCPVDRPILHRHAANGGGTGEIW
jgi:hypothetical protein